MCSGSHLAKLPSTLTSSPPAVPDTLLSFPHPHILLVTLNRPSALNAIPRLQHWALERLWDWYDDEATLRCAVITGTGRAFSAGADLKEWDGINQGTDRRSEGTFDKFPRGQFAGLSNRAGKKPVVAAVNGICFGGGMEMAVNCDMIVAASSARFGLPEVTIGVIAGAGALPRLVRTVGRQRASEMALTGKSYSAEEMKSWGLVNEVVPDGKVVEKALEWARMIAGNSPDAVIVSREGLKLGWEGMGPEQGTEMLQKGWYRRMEKGENMVEGVRSFVERRKPRWKDSKL